MNSDYFFSGQSDTGIWNVLVHDWNSSYGKWDNIHTNLVIKINTECISYIPKFIINTNSLSAKICFQIDEKVFILWVNPEISP